MANDGELGVVATIRYLTDRATDPVVGIVGHVSETNPNARNQVGFTIQFDDYIDDASASERRALEEIGETLRDLNESETFRELLRDESWEPRNIPVTVSSSQRESGNIFGGIVVALQQEGFRYETNLDYGVAGPLVAEFSLRHIVIHEVVHAVTGEHDNLTDATGSRHNDLTNQILREIGGPEDYPRSDDYGATYPPECFVAGTPILMADGSSLPIEQITPYMRVAAFDPSDGGGRAALVERPVVRLYRNVTQELVRLEVNDGREPIHVTPGHVFLDETGSFTRISDLLQLGGGVARIVDAASQEVIKARGTTLIFSEETAHLFEKGSRVATYQDGALAYEAEVEPGWVTYNFEVAELHTYVAGGIRVHNASGFLGQLGDQIDNQVFDKLGRVGDAVGDVVSGAFHAAGQLVDGVVNAGRAISDGFRDAGDSFRDGDVIGGIADIGRGIGNAIGEVAKGIGNAIGEVARGIGNAVTSVFGGNDDNDGSGDDRGKPVILDLDGDGIEVDVIGNVSFDMDADGYKERTAWVDRDDAFLVLDLNANGSRGQGDGKITRTEELVLSKWLDWEGATDLQALATFDQSAERGGNNDGRLTRADSVWSELRVWQDRDSDGVVDSGEMKTLSQMGITRINLTYDDGTHYADMSNDVTVNNSTLLGRASYWRNGQKVEGGVGDMALSYSADGFKKVSKSYGFDLVMEDLATYRYAETSGRGANVNLKSANRDGAIGDGRANKLDASGSNKVVFLEGKNGKDTLLGGNKDDTLEGGGGRDVIDGNGGKDMAVYINSNAGVFVHLLNGRMEGGHAQGDTLRDIENITGSRYDDTINGTALGNVLRGDDGNDKLYAHGGWDHVTGGDGNDTVTAGAGNDKVWGGLGNDNIFGGDDRDQIWGGSGNDRIFGQHQADQLWGDAGNDLIRGGGYSDTIDGGIGEDTLYGDTGSDRLIGGRGNDQLTGGTYGNYTDVFVFQAGDGRDRILDFQDNRDKLEFVDLSWRDLTITNVSGKARIRYDDDDYVTLDGISAGDLTQSDFIFV